MDGRGSGPGSRGPERLYRVRHADRDESPRPAASVLLEHLQCPGVATRPGTERLIVAGLSRQRKFQLARIAEGKCQDCGVRGLWRASRARCLTCVKKHRDWATRRRNRLTRNGASG